MSGPPREPNPIALAMEWVAKITTVGIQMVLPGIVGRYLDDWLGTSFLAIGGFFLGGAVGLWQMVRWTNPPVKNNRGGKR